MDLWLKQFHMEWVWQCLADNAHVQLVFEFQFQPMNHIVFQSELVRIHWNALGGVLSQGRLLH